jgi:hypothetical protein
VFDAAKLLYGLVASNLIRLKEAGAGTTPPPPMAAARAQAAQAGASGAGGPRPGTSPGMRTVTPGPGAGGAAQAAVPQSAPLLVRLGQLRDECITLLGPVGESVVQKHYLRARSEIERGAGQTAIDDAIQQIARAAGILKGSAVAEAVLQLARR